MRKRWSEKAGSKPRQRVTLPVVNPKTRSGEVRDRKGTGVKKNSRKHQVVADLTVFREQAAGAMVIGIDIGDRYSQICAMDQQGNVLQKGRLRTEGRALHEQFSVLARQRVVMETGTHSPWMSRLLGGCGHEVIVANARKLRLITENDQKCDDIDAFLLADLGRTNVRLLSPIQHRGVEAQQDLAVIRAREEMIRTRTALINHVRGAIKSNGERLPKCDSSVFQAKATGHIPEALRRAMSGMLETVERVNDQIHRYDCEVAQLVEDKYPQAKLMMQIKGVGALTALAFLLTLDDPHRFENSRTVGGYLGLVTRRRQSGERDPQLGISKAGNELVRKLLVNCAHHMLGPMGADSALRRWGLKLLARGGKKARKRAATAVARKLAVLMHHLWVSGEVYEPLRGCQEGPALVAA
jgi:transposase